MLFYFIFPSVQQQHLGNCQYVKGNCQCQFIDHKLLDRKNGWEKERRAEAKKLKAEIENHCPATVEEQAFSHSVSGSANGTATMEDNLVMSIKLFMQQSCFLEFILLLNCRYTEKNV